MFWLISAVLLWGIIHSLLASLKAKELVLQLLGRQWMQFYRLAYNGFSIFSFLPILGLAALIPDKKLYSVPLPWSAVMVAGEILAIAALLIAFKQTDALEFIGLRQLGQSQGSAKLTTNGLYHYVRHPLYTSGLLFIWLIPNMTVNLLVLNLALTAYIVIGAYFEERKLWRVFGADYRDYSAITPMFIPFLKGNKKAR